MSNHGALLPGPRSLRPAAALCVAIMLGLAGCGQAAPPPTAELTVFAAASLTEAFNEIAARFQAANSNARVVYSFAGSNQLAAQINQGAPADVFASANRAQMTVVSGAGNVAAGGDRVFARNRLVVIVPKDNPGRVSTLQDLGRPGLKLVFADKVVPVGAYSLDFLAKASAAGFSPAYSQTVLANVVSYEENVRSVLGKVTLGEADAGIVYTSDITGDARDKVSRIDIPDALNTIAVYPIAVLKNASQPTLAQRYVDFVLSAEGQAILAKHGFLPGAP